MTTNYLVCYDITEDEVRYHIASICKDFGLVRIQYSVFFGTLQRSRLASLKQQLSSGLQEANGDIHIIKVCQSCEQDHEVLTSFTISDETVFEEQSYESISEELDEFDGVLIL